MKSHHLILFFLVLLVSPLFANEYRVSLDAGFVGEVNHDTYIFAPIRLSSEIFFQENDYVSQSPDTARLDELRLALQQEEEKLDIIQYLKIEDILTGRYTSMISPDKSYILSYLNDFKDRFDKYNYEKERLESREYTEEETAILQAANERLISLQSKIEDIKNTAESEKEEIRNTMAISIQPFSEEITDIKDKLSDDIASIEATSVRRTRYGTYVDSGNNIISESEASSLTERQNQEIERITAEAAERINPIETQINRIQEEANQKLAEIDNNAATSIAEINEEISAINTELQGLSTYDSDASALFAEINSFLDVKQAEKNIKDINSSISREEKLLEKANWKNHQAQFTKIGLFVGFAYYYEAYAWWNYNRCQLSAGASFKLYDGEVYRLTLDTNGVVLFDNGYFGLGAELVMNNTFMFNSFLGFKTDIAIGAFYEFLDESRNAGENKIWYEPPIMPTARISLGFTCCFN
ncbi:MAG: hypothetical protein IAA97_01185 [Spirochaetes bacterium]|uniref:Uncharacterized protein n=1 Tax=Candidatus Ornithospirochaeta stercoripullorum TaxID=2840899 RepID=A0A9D9E0G0_9SPIO|nr:hypothetical protein [Candidatus Ornithospirochaeta stercoripullorum]